MSRFVRFSVLALVGLALLLPGAAMAKKKKKHVVIHKAELEAGQALRVDIAGDLSACQEWDCWLFIGEVKEEALYLFEFEPDGSWVAYAKEEDKSEDESDEEEEKDEESEDDKPFVEGETGKKVYVAEEPEEECDKIKLAEDEDEDKDKKKKGDEEEVEETADEEPPAWMDLPVLSAEMREKCHRHNGAAGKMSVEKLRGEVAGEAPSRYVMVPADLLPTGDFEVATNGHWGALIDGEKIGTKEKTGVVRVMR